MLNQSEDSCNMMLYSCLKETSICSNDLTNSNLVMCLVKFIDKANNGQATQVVLAFAICDAKTSTLLMMSFP